LFRCPKFPQNGGSNLPQWWGGWIEFFALSWFAVYKIALLIICQDTSTRRQRSNLFGSSSQAATYYYHSNHSKVEAIPKCLAQEHNKGNCQLTFTLFL